MANTKISDFTSGSPAQSTDEFVIARSGANFKLAASDIKTLAVGDGSVSVASGKTLTANNTLTLAGTDATTMTFPSTSATLARTDAGNTFTGAQTFSIGTVNGTGLNLTQTWSGTGTYTGLQYNVTDSGPSNAASLLMDLQVGGTSQFRISKVGRTTLTDITLWSNETPGGTTTKAIWAGPNATVIFGRGGIAYAFCAGNGFGLPSANTLGWGYSSSGGTADLEIGRRAAANLRLGAADAAAPVAQTLSVQSVVAGTSNTAGANLTITGSQGTGTGAGGEFRVDLAPPGTSGTAQNALVNAMRLIKTSSARTTWLISSNAGDAGWFADGNTFAFTSTNHNVDLPGALFQRQGAGFGFFIGSGGTRSGLFGGSEEANNTLALRNGTNAQEFRVYNTFTSSTNFERLRIFAQSAAAVLIGTEKGSGGGTARALELQTDATSRLTLDTVGSARIVTALTVATLPATPLTGMIARVTDALAPAVGVTVAAGGAAQDR